VIERPKLAMSYYYKNREKGEKKDKDKAIKEEAIEEEEMEVKPPPKEECTR
jgi:hypothetical protein